MYIFSGHFCYPFSLSLTHTHTQAATMAKAILSRPQITSLYLHVTNFFTRHTIRHYKSPPSVRLIVNPNLGFQNFPKPLVYSITDRRSISAGVTSNSSGPIDSPLMQSMQSKVLFHFKTLILLWIVSCEKVNMCVCLD